MSDRERCRAAGVGGDVVFATKPELAEKMIERAVKAGVPFSWVAVYQVRRYRALYRHITLSVLADAFLAVTARSRTPGSPVKKEA